MFWRTFYWTCGRLFKILCERRFARLFEICLRACARHYLRDALRNSLRDVLRDCLRDCLKDFERGLVRPARFCWSASPTTWQRCATLVPSLLGRLLVQLFVCTRRLRWVRCGFWHSYRQVLSYALGCVDLLQGFFAALFRRMFRKDPAVSSLRVGTCRLDEQG